MAAKNSCIAAVRVRGRADIRDIVSLTSKQAGGARSCCGREVAARNAGVRSLKCNAARRLMARKAQLERGTG
jgi:hypothetical protein